MPHSVFTDMDGAFDIHATFGIYRYGRYTFDIHATFDIYRHEVSFDIHASCYIYSNSVFSVHSIFTLILVFTDMDGAIDIHATFGIYHQTYKTSHALFACPRTLLHAQ